MVERLDTLADMRTLSEFLCGAPAGRVRHANFG
jgi:hypothetical protein